MLGGRVGGGGHFENVFYETFLCFCLLICLLTSMHIYAYCHLLLHILASVCHHILNLWCCSVRSSFSLKLFSLFLKKKWVCAKVLSPAQMDVTIEFLAKKKYIHCRNIPNPLGSGWFVIF